jgi:predicted protein tyrosine phosphatase
MTKIITCCKHGLVRSVALADVLKLHFEPVDVIPLGLNSNSKETIIMLGNWADHIIIMEERYRSRVPKELHSKVLVCDVGQDVYGNSHHRTLIDICWQWCRKHVGKLGIAEHSKRI